MNENEGIIVEIKLIKARINEKAIIVIIEGILVTMYLSTIRNKDLVLADYLRGRHAHILRD